jgi:hypothetical protein
MFSTWNSPLFSLVTYLPPFEPKLLRLTTFGEANQGEIDIVANELEKVNDSN